MKFITPFPSEFPFDPFKKKPENPATVKFHQWLIKKYGLMGRAIIFALEVVDQAKPHLPAR